VPPHADAGADVVALCQSFAEPSACGPPVDIRAAQPAYPNVAEAGPLGQA
jgi:hypothetical protein